MAGAFAPLKENFPDRATPELMELTARLGSMMPYQQAAAVLAEFLPVEPTETHATVRKRTIRIGERLDDQIAQEERRALLGSGVSRVPHRDLQSAKPLRRHQTARQQSGHEPR
ncbi:hypothetical protein JNB88_31230 [Rhizobium cauense]|uniref:hypothetical protein n=1 Tax=Rhizobium cauense TaxID=1166683 RepID=UPI001C6ECBD4|nr:hypothetical protein [Rhizobium cauense]